MIAEESQQVKRTGRARPRKEEPAPPSQTVYRLCIKIDVPSEEALSHWWHQESAFVLLTDICDHDAQVLKLYKEQHEVGGLKSPYFVGPVFLHSPCRVKAFAYVMLLALLLYSAFEHVIRTKISSG